MKQASAEQQLAYDTFVKNGMRLIYRKGAAKRLVPALDGDGDPVAGLANTVTALTLRLTESAKKAGRPMDPTAALYGAGELLEQLADYSAQSGGHRYSQEELRMIAGHMVAGVKQARGGSPAASPAPPAATTAPPAVPELMPRA